MGRIDKQLAQDALIYETSIEYRSLRSRFNPLYYILGPLKRKRIHPMNIYIARRGNPFEWLNPYCNGLVKRDTKKCS